MTFGEKLHADYTDVRHSRIFNAVYQLPHKLTQSYLRVLLCYGILLLVLAGNTSGKDQVLELGIPQMWGRFRPDFRKRTTLFNLAVYLPH